MPSTIGVSWSVSAPDSVPSGAGFPLRLEVSGPYKQVEGTLWACQHDVPVSECFHRDFDIFPGTYIEPPGSYDFNAQGAACFGDEDYYFVFSFVVQEGAKTLGPFASPLTYTHVLAPTTPLRFEPSELTFNALASHNPGADLLTIHPLCVDEVVWQVVADVPWLSLDSTSGVAREFEPGYVFVRVDATGLDPGGGPYAGTLTLSSPQAVDPIVIPVTLNMFPDVAAQWTTPPPSSVPSGTSFPLRLEVSGDFTEVRGHIRACPSDVSLDDCFDNSVFTVEPDFQFHGPPGSFDFTITGIDCEAPNDYYFVAWYDIRVGLDSFGPFLSPVTTTRLLTRSKPLLQARTFLDPYTFPFEMHFSALEGQSPPGERLMISSVCGEPIDWVVAGSTPWLRGNPGSGATDSASSSTVVQVDATGLAAAAAPFGGMLTVSSPQAANAVRIPVAVDVLGGVNAQWTIAAPGSVASGRDFPLSLTVTGPFDEVGGDIFACRSDQTLDECIFGDTTFATFAIEPRNEEGWDFSGPPGTFHFVANGVDCQGSNDYYVIASLFIRQGDEFGSFYSPPTTTRLLKATAPVLAVSRSELEFHALAGLNPAPQGITIRSVCGETVDWSIASDAPWVGGVPASGTADSSGTPSAVTVDATSLYTGELFNGMLTVSSPQTEHTVSVAVTLRIFTGNGNEAAP
jgi:hypothetical protein